MNTTSFRKSILWTLFAALVGLFALMLPAQSRADALPSQPLAADSAQETAIQHPTIKGLISDHSQPPLVFHYPAEYQEALGPLLAEAPAIRDNVLKDFPQKPLPTIHVYLLPEIEAYFTSLSQAPRSPHWASGLALLSQDVILVRLQLATPGGKLELNRTLGHEFSHVTLHHMAHEQRLPHWFIEGLAMYQTEPWSIERAQPLTEALKLGKLIPLSSISARFPSNHFTAQLAYAESAHFFFWLREQYGPEAIPAILAALHNGATLPDAFEAATGQPLWLLEAHWQQSLTVSDTWIPVTIEALTIALTFVVIFAAVVLFLRRKRAEQARIEAMQSADPPAKIPPHLQHFSPFTHHNSHS